MKHDETSLICIQIHFENGEHSTVLDQTNLKKRKISCVIGKFDYWWKPITIICYIKTITKNKIN